MKSECLALNEFLQIHFEERKEAIQILMNELIIEIENLEVKNEITQEGHCNVCNSPLKTYDTLGSDKTPRSITVCPNCPEKINHLLNKLDWATSTVFI
ncbi:hypothetical protein FY557_12045 [Chryseobacterium sp. SN22]|uniref:hypothetical protein n=1 Tax=Chryseobacterium sp. SN22 TaxID=2606431 RepID=UPI0011EEA1C3|nr:hypothetical protein [Chryseobacterium sp. SN22]KAA0127612.1 hypothetical protein FY557_12045 [Chryseobacterium sp. SN22]